MVSKLRVATEALPAPSARRARAAGEQGHKRFTRYYTSLDTLPAQTARRARAAGEQGHKRFTRSYTLALLMLWSLLRCCSSWCSRPRRYYTLAVLMLGLLLPLLRCCSSWCWRSCSCPSCCSRCSCVAFSAWGSLVSRASRSMIARFFGPFKTTVFTVFWALFAKNVLACTREHDF